MSIKDAAHGLVSEATRDDSLVVLLYREGGSITMGAEGKNLFRLPVMARALLQEAAKLIEKDTKDAEDLVKIMQLCAAMLPSQDDIEPDEDED